MLFEILTGKAVASQDRAALRIGPWLQVPVKPAMVLPDPSPTRTKEFCILVSSPVGGGFYMRRKSHRKKNRRPIDAVNANCKAERLLRLKPIRALRVEDTPQIFARLALFH